MINRVWRGFACQQDVFFAQVRKFFFGAFFLGTIIYIVPGLAQAGCISGTCGAPIVSVYSPSNNASLPASQNITISGRAFGDVVWTWDGESYNFPINRVDIYRDGSVVGQATLGPTSYTDDEIPYNDFTYTFVGGIASPGSHTLSAKPFDTGSNAFAAAGQVQTIAISIAAPPQNGALVISASAPSPMTQGQSYLVSVTMQNTGNTTWPAGSAYKLGSKNPIDNWTWGTARPTSSNASVSAETGGNNAFTNLLPTETPGG